MIDFTAFIDEVEKIKEAGFLQNVGSFVSRHAQGIGKNLAGTAGTVLRPGQAMREGMKATVDSMKTPGWGGKINTALLVGGTGLMIPSVVKKEDPSGQGASRIARGARFAGGTIGGIMATPFGLSGGIAGGIAGDAVGKRVGSAIDRVRGLRKTPAQAAAYDSQGLTSPHAAFNPTAPNP